MNKLMNSYGEFLLLLLFLAIIYGLIQIKPTPAYKVGQCAKDKLNNTMRRIVKVSAFMYEYRIRKRSNTNTMRIQSFEQLHYKVDCDE